MNEKLKDLIPLYCVACRALLGRFDNGNRVGVPCHKCNRMYVIELEDNQLVMQVNEVVKHDPALANP